MDKYGDCTEAKWSKIFRSYETASKFLQNMFTTGGLAHANSRNDNRNRKSDDYDYYIVCSHESARKGTYVARTSINRGDYHVPDLEWAQENFSPEALTDFTGGRQECIYERYNYTRKYCPLKVYIEFAKVS